MSCTQDGAANFATDVAIQLPYVGFSTGYKRGRFVDFTPLKITQPIVGIQQHRTILGEIVPPRVSALFVSMTNETA